MQTAVLVIDVQRGLFDAHPRPFEADTVVHRINGLTRRARLAGVPVAFIQHERSEGLLAFRSESWLLQEQLQIARGDALFRKTTADSFLRTELGAWLEQRGVVRLVVCGYATEFCIDTTVRRAAALGYEVALAADGHTTHDKAHAKAVQIRVHHNATLSAITSFGPRIAAIDCADIDFQP